MSIAPGLTIASVAEILHRHVRLQIAAIDRMYLNVYVPQLQLECGVLRFFHAHRKQPWASSALMQPISRRFVAALERFITVSKLPFVVFRRRWRKDDVMREQLQTFPAQEGIVFIGKAQEKTAVFRTEKRHNPATGRSYPWIVTSSAMGNHYYVYAEDRDFGPFFVKFCTYFSYNARLCLNGHEYAKRQLDKRGIPYPALDNGVLSCADPARRQAKHPPPVIRYRRPADRRTRSQRWHDAVAELFALQAEYTAWFDVLPESPCGTVTAAALQAIVELDLDELAAIEPPRGFGRD